MQKCFICKQKRVPLLEWILCLGFIPRMSSAMCYTCKTRIRPDLYFRKPRNYDNHKIEKEQ